MKRFQPTILALLSFTSGFSQWKNATPLSSSVNDIVFTDRYTGYAALTTTQIGNCSNTSPLNIYKTIDQGENWILLNTGISASLTSIYFINNLRGFAGTSSNLYNTVDGGETWTVYSGSLGTGVNDITFSTAQNGILIGSNGAIRRTTNGGSSWQFITSGVTSNLYKVYFFNAQLGFIACSNGQLLRTINGGASWSIITTGSSSLRDMCFLSVTDGFAVGYVTNGYSVLKTVDGGLTWNVQQALTIGGYPLNRITFSSSTNGCIASGGQGIYKTNDGGNTWTQTLTFNGGNDNWQGMCFVDNNIGFVCGNGGRIMKTTDGGITWKSSVCGSSAAMYTVCAINKKTAYAGGNAGVIIKTTNGGLNWKQKAKAFSSSIINKMYFVNDSTGFACSDSGKILKTIDAGENWNLKPTNSYRFIYDFSFINKDTGYASSENGIIFRTYDNGETWDSINVGASDNLTGIFFINKDTGFVCGTTTIYRTYNAGTTWIATQIAIASYLTDIVFTNDSLGYCAGGFGKLLFTTDAGLNWYPTNNMTTNAEIEEISAVNDSVLYFARYVSQYFTLDSGKVLGSQSTACLQNNYTMHSISMTNGGLNGYCTGGISKELVHIKEQIDLETSVGTNAYCAGSKIPVACIGRGYLQTGCVINIELSDATGSFTSPTVIGSYTPTSIYVYQSGIVTATIPANTPSGLYRVRSVSTAPVFVGNDNGFDISIGAQTTPTVNLLSNINGSTCAGSQFVFTTQPTAGGLNPSFQWLVNGVDINNNSSVYNTDTLQNGDDVKVILTSDLTCVSNSVDTSNSYMANISNIVVSAGNDTTVCQGIAFHLHASGGTQYSWNNTTSLSNMNIASPIAILTSNENFVATITDANACSAMDTLHVNVIMQPIASTISALGSTTFCAGNSLMLMGNNGGTWNDGSTASDTLVANSGSYFVTTTNSCGSTVSNTISVIVNLPPTPPTISAMGNITFCAGGSVILMGNNGGTWNDGSTASDTLIMNTGLYFVTTTNSCGSGVSNSIAVTVNSVDTSVVVGNASLFANASNASYQWLQCNGNYTAISGETNQTFQPASTIAFYAVEVTQNGCVDTSACYPLIVTSLTPSPSPKERGAVTCYPNPANDILTIVFPYPPQTTHYNLIIQNTLGEIVYSKANCNALESIDLSSFAKGMYIIKTNNQQLKFIKQ